MLGCPALPRQSWLLFMYSVYNTRDEHSVLSVEQQAGLWAQEILFNINAARGSHKHGVGCSWKAEIEQQQVVGHAQCCMRLCLVCLWSLILTECAMKSAAKTGVEG